MVSVRRWFLKAFLVVFCYFSYTSQVYSQADSARIVVSVGAGIRPPFFIDEKEGMGPEILAAFNRVQDKFRFELSPVPISRRIQAIEDGWVDLVMWDNINWGWRDTELTSSKPLLYSKDVFLTLNTVNQSQRYFDQLQQKRICIVNGYHYRFLNYSNDYKSLSEIFNLTLVTTETSAIKMALFGRCDISVASESAISWFFKKQPDAKSRLLISERFDTEYTRHFLVPARSPVTAAELNQIIDAASELGLLTPIYKKYGQKLPL